MGGTRHRRAANIAAMDSTTMQRGIDELVARWAADRPARQARRHLERSDFDDLAAAGYLLTGVPAARGGLFDGIAASSRPTCEALRALASGDPSVALGGAMRRRVRQRPRWGVVGHDHLRTGQRRRHRPHPCDRTSRG
jgi:alkylation response protein AidB-like acyl-CoA dehydrogenase